MEVTVFTRNSCAACNGTKAALTKLGVEFNEINIQAEGNEGVADKLVGDGWRVMPVVRVERVGLPDEWWGGSQPDLIRELAAA